ncbi:hypothetical protein GUJ93_ZPchr0010g10724 [Zizania palustris]|uniref:Uncharacterized protein n=1 Tax=Zizania palustris TaxID=103762 RepID=A0A8J5WF75_ZIZPA|nr:hypothetical protein GUJ93_ZPchr0010g10724 [Zizania palustris]
MPKTALPLLLLRPPIADTSGRRRPGRLHPWDQHHRPVLGHISIGREDRWKPPPLSNPRSFIASHCRQSPPACCRRCQPPDLDRMVLISLVHAHSAWVREDYDAVEDPEFYPEVPPSLFADQGKYTGGERLSGRGAVELGWPNLSTSDRNGRGSTGLLTGIDSGPTEFERVSHLSTAREIWATLQAHHEGTAQSIINKLRANKANGVQLVSYHEQALKLRSNLTGFGSKTLALATPSADSSSLSCAGFSLMSITEDQLDSLGDDDMCHFIADYPKRNSHKKGTDGGSYDFGKHDSSTFTKGKPKMRFFRKDLKDYQRENKK